jgi:hypothetical protein
MAAAELMVAIMLGIGAPVAGKIMRRLCVNHTQPLRDPLESASAFWRSPLGRVAAPRKRVMPEHSSTEWAPISTSPPFCS